MQQKKSLPPPKLSEEKDGSLSIAQQASLLRRRKISDFPAYAVAYLLYSGCISLLVDFFLNTPHVTINLIGGIICLFAFGVFFSIFHEKNYHLQRYKSDFLTYVPILLAGYRILEYIHH